MCHMRPTAPCTHTHTNTHTHTHTLDPVSPTAPYTPPYTHTHTHTHTHLTLGHPLHQEPHTRGGIEPVDRGLFWTCAPGQRWAVRLLRVLCVRSSSPFGPCWVLPLHVRLRFILFYFILSPVSFCTLKSSFPQLFHCWLLPLYVRLRRRIHVCRWLEEDTCVSLGGGFMCVIRRRRIHVCR